MQLNEKDKAYLRKIGHKDTDFWQIEQATRKTVYEHNGQRISCKTARGLLGRESFLAGISRSAFHWSAAQYLPDGSEVSFDSSRLFKEA